MESHTSTSTSTTKISSTISQNFSADGKTDTTFQSCDNVLFYVERKYIEYKSTGFPPSEFETCPDVIHLSETAEVLELLFEFLYPRRPPSLEELSFELLDAFTEAVEKYEVFSALAICEVYMRAAMESHPIQVLRYAAKHDHQRTMEDACAIGIKKDPWAVLNCGLTYGIKKLINTAAEAALCTAIEDVPDVLDPTRLGAWMKYYGQWFTLWKDVCSPNLWSLSTFRMRGSFETYVRIHDDLLSRGPGCLLDSDNIFVCVGTENQDCIDLVEKKRAWATEKKKELRLFSDFL